MVCWAGTATYTPQPHISPGHRADLAFRAEVSALHSAQMWCGIDPMKNRQGRRVYLHGSLKVQLQEARARMVEKLLQKEVLYGGLPSGGRRLNTGLHKPRHVEALAEPGEWTSTATKLMISTRVYIFPY
jgi:hypothetical protein